MDDLIKCNVCERFKDETHYLEVDSLFLKRGKLPFCNECLGRLLEKNDYSWDFVDKLCQFCDLPFLPKEFEAAKQYNGRNLVFPAYVRRIRGMEYDDGDRLDWRYYYEQYKELEESGRLIDELPGLSDERRRELAKKWGPNYDDEALEYLEELYEGLLLTQNVNGTLQTDRAYKICKISYELDCRIRAGEDFDKMLSSYDKLTKIAEFTPKNVKDASDFESMGELVKWLEKGGFKNHYYDDVTRDVVDESIKNIQSWNQRLYTNESGIGDEINRRIESLRAANELENYYDLNTENTDFDEYEKEGYDSLMEEPEEFAADIEEDKY